MKKLFILCVTILLCSCGGQTVNEDDFTVSLPNGKEISLGMTRADVEANLGKGIVEEKIFPKHILYDDGELEIGYTDGILSHIRTTSNDYKTKSGVFVGMPSKEYTAKYPTNDESSLMAAWFVKKSGKFNRVYDLDEGPSEGHLYSISAFANEDAQTIGHLFISGGAGLHPRNGMSLDAQEAPKPAYMRKSEWGMSLMDVKRAEMRTPFAERDNLLVYSAVDFYDLDSVQLTYAFEDNNLSRIMYAKYENNLTMADIYFSQVEMKMSDLYGRVERIESDDFISASVFTSSEVLIKLMLTDSNYDGHKYAFVASFERLQ